MKLNAAPVYGRAVLRQAKPRRSRRRSNGEVEGPGTHVDQAPRAHTVFPRPRRQTDRASRPPRTIVSSRLAPTRVLLRSVSRNGNRQPDDSLRSFTEHVITLWVCPNHTSESRTPGNPQHPSPESGLQ